MNAAEIVANASEAGGSSPLPTDSAGTGENSSAAGLGGSFAEAIATQVGDGTEPGVSGSASRHPHHPEQTGQEPELVEDASGSVLPADNGPPEVSQNTMDTLANVLSLRLGSHGPAIHGGDRPAEGGSASDPARAVVPDQSAEKGGNPAHEASNTPLSAPQHSPLPGGAHGHVPESLPGSVFNVGETATDDGMSQPDVAVVSAMPSRSVADGPPVKTSDSTPVGDSHLPVTQPTVPGDGVQTQPTVPGDGVQTQPTVPGDGVQTQPTVPGDGVQTQPTVPGDGVQTQPTVPGDGVQTQPTRVTATPQPSDYPSSNTTNTTNTTAAPHPAGSAAATENKAPSPTMAPGAPASPAQGVSSVTHRDPPADVHPSTPANGDVPPEAALQPTRRAAVPGSSSASRGDTGREVASESANASGGPTAVASAPEQDVAAAEGAMKPSRRLGRLLGLSATLAKGDVAVSGGSGSVQTPPLLLDLPGLDREPMGALFPPFSLPEPGENTGELLAMAFGAQRADAQRYAEIARLLEQGEHAAEHGARSSSVSGAAVTAIEAVPEWIGATLRSSIPQTQLSDLEQLELPDQLIRAIRMQWRNGVGEAKLRLTPQHLGEVMVSLQVRQGSVSVVLTADTDLVRDWIRTHQNELKSLLASQGLRLENLVVEEDGHPGRQPDQQFERDRRPTVRPASGEVRFEVRV